MWAAYGRCFSSCVITPAGRAANHRLSGSILDRDRTCRLPPARPSEGDRCIIASGGSGMWIGWARSIAYYVDGAWMRFAPWAGWRNWFKDERVLLVFDGTSWISTVPTELQSPTRLGLGTTADAINPFSAKPNAAL